MANKDLFLRSDVDKGEVSPDTDLRLRADADKEAADEFVYVGDISMTVLPDDPMAILSKSYAGNIPMSALPSYSSARIMTYAGAIAIALVPNSTYSLLFEYVYAGDVVMAVLPSYASIIDMVYAGDISIVASPSSVCVLDRVYTGDIFATIMPDFPVALLSKSYSGDISFVLLPDSIYELSEPSAGEFVYAGDISLIALPSYSSILDRIYQGMVALNILPEFSEAKLEKGYGGDIDFTLAPDALYSLEQILQEFAYEGILSFDLNPNSQYSLETPEGYVPAEPKATIYELSDELKALGNYEKKKHFSHAQLATDMNRFGWQWTENHIAAMLGGKVVVGDEHKEYLRRYLLTRYYNETLKEA